LPARCAWAPALAAALASPAGYAGTMGSRKTQQRRTDWLREHTTDEDDIAAIMGPSGLDIGADTPAEVAVSIVAEIIAAAAGTNPGSLGDRDGRVHPERPRVRRRARRQADPVRRSNSAFPQVSGLSSKARGTEERSA